MKVTKQMREMREAGMTYEAIGRTVGRSRSCVYAAFRDDTGEGQEAQVPEGRTAEAFAEQFSEAVIIPKKIREGLEQIGETWVYERELMSICGVSRAELGLYRDQFSDYVVRVRKNQNRVWAGTVEMAAEMREMLSKK